MNDRYDDIAKARRMLADWCSGHVGPELWLRRFFAEAGELPPDLEAERALFLALSEADSEPVEMPESLRLRVEAGVEAAMRVGSRGRWRRTIRWSAAAASLALVALSGIALLSERDTPDFAAPLAAVATGIETPANVESPAMESAPAPRQIASAVSPARGATHKAKPRRKAVPAEMEAQPASDQSSSLYADLCAEEAEMMARGYHVVRSDEEARAIVGLVMARMNENVAESTFMLEDIGDKMVVSL